MLLKKLSPQNQRQYFPALLAVGIVSLALGLALIVGSPEDSQVLGVLGGALCGFGFAASVLSSIKLIHLFRHSAEELQREFTAKTDARSQLIWQKTLSVVAMVAFLLQAVLAIVFLAMGYLVCGILCTVSLYGILLVGGIALAVTRRSF